MQIMPADRSCCILLGRSPLVNFIQILPILIPGPALQSNFRLNQMFIEQEKKFNEFVFTFICFLNVTASTYSGCSKYCLFLCHCMSTVLCEAGLLYGKDSTCVSTCATNVRLVSLRVGSSTVSGLLGKSGSCEMV